MYIVRLTSEVKLDYTLGSVGVLFKLTVTFEVRKIIFRIYARYKSNCTSKILLK